MLIVILMQITVGMVGKYIDLADSYKSRLKRLNMLVYKLVHA